MQQLIQDLAAAGFSPLNIALVVAIVMLWKLFDGRDKAQRADRIAWHEETRSKLATVEKHTDECEKDRQHLNARVEQLSKSVEDMSRCPKPDCPVRIR